MTSNLMINFIYKRKAQQWANNSHHFTTTGIWMIFWVFGPILKVNLTDFSAP